MSNKAYHLNGFLESYELSYLPGTHDPTKAHLFKLSHTRLYDDLIQIKIPASYEVIEVCVKTAANLGVSYINYIATVHAHVMVKVYLCLIM